MKLKLVYGRSGTGKSRYIYEDILKNMSDKKIYLVVPEQYNLTAEKMLFEILNQNALLNVEVLTLSRMAHRISVEVGGKENVKLTKAGKNMLIYDVLSKEKQNLNFLGNSEKNIEIVDRMFTELKKHNVSLEDLKLLELEDEYIKLKVRDIIALYERYEEALKNSFIDEDDILTLLKENIDKSTMFENTYIYIDEFLGFTKQEYDVFTKILEKADKVIVSVSTDSLDAKPIENDIFYFNKKFLNKLIDISHGLNYEVEEVVLDDNSKKYKSDELKFLEENMFFTNRKYDKENKDIKLFFAKNPYSEIEFVASNIHNLVSKCGYRYNEIAVITENLDGFKEDVKVIFNKYNIPVFIDEKKDLNQNVLIRFVISLLDLFAKNFSFDAVMDYLKIGLLDIDNNDIYLLENYAKKWDIRGNRWKNKFEYEQINDIQERLETLRKSFIEPVCAFKDNISKERTYEEISKEIYKFLIDNNITKVLEEKIKLVGSKELLEEYNTSYSTIINILEEMTSIFKDEKVSFEKYKDIFEIGINASDLGKIPFFQDAVILGDTERSRNGKIKVAFIIGVNDGIFPAKIGSEGYLNDKDREYLKTNGLELAKTSIEDVFEQEFNFYRTFTLPSEKLFITYSSSGKDGSSIRPSILLKKIKRTFPNIKEESDVVNDIFSVTTKEATFEDALRMYKMYLDGDIKEIDDKWIELLNYFYKKEEKKFKRSLSGIKYSNLSEKINEKNLQKLYKGRIDTSISKIEKYRSCPFSYYLHYGLKLKEKEEMKINSLDTGSFMHEVLEAFFDYVKDNNIKFIDLTDEAVKEIVYRLIDNILSSSKYYVFTYSNKYKILTLKLKTVVYEAIKYIVYTLTYTDFKVLGNEVEFSNKGKYKPIRITLNDGKEVEITGKIDRVDVAKYEDETYVRIIDYKSSVKSIDLNKVVAGLQVQLITYLDAISEAENYIPSGVLYMPMIENIISSKERLTDEEIENKIKKEFRMNGIILNDIKVVQMMDNRLTQGSSDIIPAKLTKGGELGKSNSLIDSVSFKSLQKKVKGVLKDISNEMINGNIDIKPYYYKKHTGCDYCEYKSICMFNTNIKNNEYNIIKNKGKDLILEELNNNYAEGKI